MKIFWPYRSDPKGFSIENFARKYREKVSKLSSNDISKELLDDKKFKSNKKNLSVLELSSICVKRVHWANRDFAEYKEAA